MPSTVNYPVMPKKSTTNVVVYPWPEDKEFLKAWDTWKEYKRLEWKFLYKSPISEQAALVRLTQLSEGHADKAIEIINFSIANGWQGLYPDKSTIKTIANAKQNSRNNAIDEIAGSLFNNAPEQLYLGGSTDTGGDTQ